MTRKWDMLTKLLYFSNLVLVALLIGISWTIVYFLSYIPLAESGGLGHLLSLLENAKLRDTLWWREFLADAFDLLIILVAIIGTSWVLGHFAVETREFRKWKRYYKEKGADDIWVKRFGLWERVQHIWMMITFIICAFTGFVMYFANNPYWRFFYTSRETYVEIHVLSGLAMGVLVILHFGYYTVQAIMAKRRGEMLFVKYPILNFYRLRFYKTFVRRLLWTIDAKVKPLKVGKFNCEQMFEYWGVYWGIAVLGIPGAIMAVIGPQALDGVLWVMHTKEAVLALTFIILVHISYTHLRPSIYPIDPVFLTGKMPLGQIKEEHPEWYDELVDLGVVKPQASSTPVSNVPSPGGES